MSFAIWRSKPPFAEADLNRGEKIYQVGEVWIVTDGSKPSPEDVAAILNPPPAPKSVADLVLEYCAGQPDASAEIKAAAAQLAKKQ